MAETVTEAVKDVPEEKWETLIEGKAKILHKPGEAFYNPAQVVQHTLILSIIFVFLLKLETMVSSQLCHPC